MLTQKEELECAIKEVIAEMYNVVSGYPYGVCPKTCMVSEKECNAQGGQDADTCRACWRLYTRTLYERIINIYDQMERKKRS